MGIYNYLICLKCNKRAFVVKRPSSSEIDARGSAGVDDALEFLEIHSLCTPYVVYAPEWEISGDGALELSYKKY
jgi:hypothetical protein